MSLRSLLLSWQSVLDTRLQNEKRPFYGCLLDKNLLLQHVDDPFYISYRQESYVMVERKFAHESSSGVANRFLDASDQNDTDPERSAKSREGQVPSQAASTFLKFQDSLDGYVDDYLIGFWRSKHTNEGGS